MIRFMGFVTGAAIAIGLMLFLFGVPELPAAPAAETPPESPPVVVPEPAIADAPPPAADAQAPAPEGVSEPAPPEPESTTAPEPVPTTETLAAARVEPPPPSDDVEPDAGETPPATGETPVEMPPDVAIAVGDGPLAADLKWHAFWSPFRSRIAADGFVGRLESVTGFDYRVVKMDNGIYEVAFAYASDDERLSKLEAIEAATGLEMPGS